MQRRDENLQMKGSENTRMCMVGGTLREEREKKKKKKTSRELENSSGKHASSAEQWERVAVLISVARWEMTICLLLFFIRT